MESSSAGAERTQCRPLMDRRLCRRFWPLPRRRRCHQHPRQHWRTSAWLPSPRCPSAPSAQTEMALPWLAVVDLFQALNILSQVGPRLIKSVRRDFGYGLCSKLGGPLHPVRLDSVRQMRVKANRPGSSSSPALRRCPTPRQHKRPQQIVEHDYRSTAQQPRGPRGLPARRYPGPTLYPALH